MPKISPKVILAALGAVMAVAMTAYALWWYWLAGALEAGIQRWAAERNAAGWRIETGPLTRQGFPLALRFAFAAPVIREPGGIGWQGPPMTAIISPFAPDRVALAAPGRHALDLPGGARVELTAGEASANLAIGPAGPDQVGLRLSQVTGPGASLGRLEATLRRLAGGAVPHTQASWGLALGVDELVLANRPELVLGPRVASLRLDAQLMGSIGGGAWRDSLAGWRDDGGTLKIDRLAVDWPPLGLSGTGTLALDRDLQPLLASSCTLRGLFDAVDGLVRAGFLKAGDARMVKLVLGLLARPGADGTPELTVPVTIQDGVLYVGPAALMRVPKVAW